MNKKRQIHVVRNVLPDSIAEECGFEPGDGIVEINGHRIEDIFDYQYYMEDEFLEILAVTKDGEECVIEVEKDPDEDLGIVFENSLMDDYKSCSNKCVFCFIDQMPPGMRETLYFKDDDSRLSFLQGNYITLTNMDYDNIDRIIQYHLAPINISVHTTNPELRIEMLHNRFAGDILEKIRRLYDAGIPMNSQIVLCRGINDGKELDRTIRDLSEFLPYMESLSVVPVGMTRYREGLAKLESFGKEDAEKVLNQILRWQERLRKEHGTNFVHASDEWFILAERDIPPAEYYEGYGQLENGVGMIRLLCEEVHQRLSELSGDDRRKTLSIATGVLAWPTIRRLADEVTAKYPNIEVHVYRIINHFFGESITVSGLITGRDLIEQLKGENLGEELLIPCNMMKADENVFLDDISIEILKETLQIPVKIVKSEGEDFVNQIIGD